MGRGPARGESARVRPRRVDGDEVVAAAAGRDAVAGRVGPALGAGQPVVTGHRPAGADAGGADLADAAGRGDRRAGDDGPGLTPGAALLAASAQGLVPARGLPRPQRGISFEWGPAEA